MANQGLPTAPPQFCSYPHQVARGGTTRDISPRRLWSGGSYYHTGGAVEHLPRRHNFFNGSTRATETSHECCHPSPKGNTVVFPDPERCLSAPGQPTTFYIIDEASKRSYLVDTGACRSFIPHSGTIGTLATYTGSPIYTANGEPLQIKGMKRLHLSLHGRKYEWSFIVADVSTALLGADFLKHYHLAVDVGNKRLLSTTPASAALQDSSSIQGLPGDIKALMEEFKDVLQEDLRNSPKGSPKHGVFHHIQTEGTPCHSRFRRLPPEKLKVAKQVFAELEEAGICVKASSPWASPLHMVPKQDGSWRPCGDYRRLNTKTIPDRYPLPNINDITNVLAGAKFFTKLDLLKGYYQVPIAEEDQQKTAVITPFGTYVFKYTCFGLRNAGATFQRLMDTIFGNIPYVVIYVDDILIFSSSYKQHLQHLRAVLELLRDNGLLVKPSKCTWAQQEVEFLGHAIDASGFKPLPQKVSAVEGFPTPTNIKSLQEFAGMVNYYHRFIPNAAKIMAPLYEALKGRPKKLLWGPPQEEAFANTKVALSRATRLTYPTPGKELILTTDASNYAVGAVLEQEAPEGRQPIAFYSKKLAPTEQKYSTFDRELLAMHLAVRHFRHFVECRPFKLLTDHLPLVHAFARSSDAWSSRQQRHLSAISEFPCTIAYIKGSSNQVADALSRNSINAVQLGISYIDIADAQSTDEELSHVRANNTSLKWIDVDVGGKTLACETSTGRSRPYLPKSLRQQAFDTTHNLSHPSAKSTIKILSERYVWEGMRSDVRKWCQACLQCQTSKVGRHTKSPITPLETSAQRLAHIHVDIVGPLPPSEGYRYLLTIIDRNTRWPEAIPLRQQTADACTSGLINWVSRFGVPESIVSDRGANFTSKLWENLASALGTTVKHTTSYNPACNGLVERFHRSLKTALTARCQGHNWKKHLPWVLLGLRTTPHAALGTSPAEALYATPIRIPADSLPGSPTPQSWEDLHQSVDEWQPPVVTYQARQSYLPPTLGSAPFVFLRIDHHKPPLTPPYEGPYAVLERREKTYKINWKGKQTWVGIDRLKPAYTSEVDGSAL